MTEEEAKTKWCPFTRIVPLPTDVKIVSARIDNVQDRGLNSINTNCIGSACMAWREVTKMVDIGDPVYVGAARTWTKCELKVVGGYCGLAGKP